MTPKQTALLRIAQLITLGALAGFVVNVIFTYFTVAQVGVGFCTGMLIYLCKMIYDLEVARAEHIQGLEKLKDLK